MNAELKWYVGAMNDGLFIINAKPNPDHDNPWHDNPNGPSLAIPVSGLTLETAQKICDAHNALFDGKVLVPVGLIDEAVKALTPVVKCRTYFFDERATVGLKVLVEAMIAASQEQGK